MELNADFKSYQERVTTSLVNITKTASQVSSQDISFHRSSSEQFSQSLDAQSTHLLRLTNKLLKAASKDTSVKAPTLQTRDDIEDKWRGVVDVIDDLLEKADRSLDEFTGVIKRLSPARQDGAELPTKKFKPGQGIDLVSSQNMSKPQLLFERKVNNHETAPWKPLLTTKPHANMPLEESIGSGEDGFKHPYAHEIQYMIYPKSTYEISPPIPFAPPEERQPVFVDTEEALHEMLTELKSAKEIAIDLEHHDRHSYIGLVCLMQISTREKDWIVDTLKPWRENLQVLNEVFANPRIIKVFHGANSDIIWLQRDLGLYVVGLFDTYHASNTLQFPSKSLKYLLERFANFEAQKQYQLADWRVRPLPQELIDYARSDTHFLLHIYDQLRNMLIEESTPHENLVEHVLDCSRREALQVYERPVYDKESGLNPGGWMRLLLQRSSPLTNEQLGVFRAIHEWRDKKARELDEGEQNIMPNAYIWTVAENMPRFRGAFFQRGAGRLSRYVAENIPEIIEVVKQGIEEGKEGPSVHQVIEKYGSRVGYMFGRNKYMRRKVEDPNRGVGATLQMLNDSREVVASPAFEGSSTTPVTHSEPIAIKSTISQLWGTIQPLNAQILPNPGILSQALKAILPLHGLLQNPFNVNDKSAPSGLSSDSLDSGAIPNSVSNGVSQNASEAETFVLKDRFRKRKASDALVSDQEDDENKLLTKIGAGDDADEDRLSLNADTTSRHKLDLKRSRKAEKRAKKEAETAARAEAEASVVPFDYANAESMLHAKPDAEHSAEVPGKKKRDKPLNPFVKALDTGTGARRNRMGKELAGRSHTFKG